MATSTYTLAQMRTDLKRIVVPEGNSPWQDDEYDRRIQQAIREIAETKEISELEITNSSAVLTSFNTRSYSLTSLNPPVFALCSVRLADADNDLLPLSRDQADNYDADATGEPKEYFDWGQSIELYPLPALDWDGVYLVIRYIADPVMPSENVASPLPASYDRAIINYAAYLTFEDNHESDRALRYLQGYLAMTRSRKNRRTRTFAKQTTSISVSRR